MQATAQGYLIYDLTRSSEFLGYVGFVSGLPSWFFTLYAGAVADRMSKRNLIMITQASMMVLALILAVLTFTGVVQAWHILILAFLLGVANAFDAPARQSFTLEMVDRPALTNAIALNAAMFTGAIVIGPAAGGLTYAWLGPGWCFTLNGISFIAVLVALGLMRLQPLEQPVQRNKMWTDLGAGLQYVMKEKTTRMLIINLGVIGTLAMGVITLLPAWAVKILGGDATTNGWLLSARGAGSLISALIIAAQAGRAKRGRLWTIGSFAMPVCMLVMSYWRTLTISLIMMALIGWAFIMMLNSTNALVQSMAPDNMRGRVMGVYTLVLFGSSPIGSIISGWLAEAIGEPNTLAVISLVLLVFSAIVWWRTPHIRQLI
jgi:MFS family permease